MALHSDLLVQARYLARKEPRRPKQASLRRAVSAGYYALFHFLIDKATRLVISGAGADRQSLRGILSRAFNHGQMRKVSESFGGNRSNPWKDVFAGPVPSDLRTIASSFVDLQQARHEADYDLTRDLTRAEVLALITQAQQAVQLWPNVANQSHSRAFLLGLLVNTRK